jgi:hypothetical protein
VKLNVKGFEFLKESQTVGPLTFATRKYIAGSALWSAFPQIREAKTAIDPTKVAEAVRRG